MAKPHKGGFIPKNPSKYIGTGKIQYRSSWELGMMLFFDKTESILAWSSESISIPYRNPLTLKQTVYVPDFLIVYQDKNGKKHAEMIEVKPAKEVPGLITEGFISKRTKLAQVLNAAKWQAAAAFCAKRNIRFRVVTEKDLYPVKGRK